MSLFGRMTGDRFEKEQEESVIGPGSYELPTSLDDHGARISGPDRFVDADGVETPGPGFYAEGAEKEKESKAEKSMTRTPSKKRTGLSSASKENRSAMTPRALQEKTATPIADAKPASRKSIAMTAEAREVEQLKRQLNHEEKLRVQAESKAAELSAAKKWAAEAQVQVQSKDRRIDDMHRKIEEMTAKYKDSQTKIREMEAHGGGARKAMQEKDNATAALHKGLDQAKTMSSKLKDQLDKAEAELKQQKSNAIEVEKAKVEELAKVEEASRAEMVAKLAQLKVEQDEKRKLTKELAAALEKVSKLAEELTKIRADLETERDQAKTELANTRSRLEAEHDAKTVAQAEETSSKAQALAEMSSSSEQEIAAIRAAHENTQKALQQETAKLAEAKDQLAGSCSSLQETSQRLEEERAKVVAAEELARTALEEAEKNNAKAIYEVELNAKANSAKAIDEAEALKAKAVAEAVAEAEERGNVVQALKAEHESAVGRLKEELEAEKERAAAAVEDVRAQHESAVGGLKAEHEIAKARAAEEVKDVRAQHEEAVAAAITAHGEEVSTLTAQLEKTKQDNEAALAVAMDAHTGAVAAHGEEASAQLDALKVQHDAALAAVNAESAGRWEEEQAAAEAASEIAKAAVEAASERTAAAEAAAAAAEAATEAASERAAAAEAAEAAAKAGAEAASERAAAAEAAETAAKAATKAATERATAAEAAEATTKAAAETAEAAAEAQAHAQEQKIERITQWREQDREQWQQALATTSAERDTALDDKGAFLKEHQDCKQALTNERADKESLICDAEQLQQDREQTLQELAEERLEKQSLQEKLLTLEKEHLESEVDQNEKIKNLELALEEKSGNAEVEDLQQKCFDLEMQACSALRKSAESEGALKDAEARLEETKKSEAELKTELAKMQKDDCRIRKEEKARFAEVQESEQKLQAEVSKLGFAEKRSQMFETAKKKAEQESKDQKKELEQLRQTAANMEVDAGKLQSLEEHAALRDRESVDLQDQNKELLKSIQFIEKDYEACVTENRSLQESLMENEADLEHTKDENAKLMGHTNHKQKVHYHIKIKDENAQLKQDLTKTKQRLSQYEVGQRGSSLLEALAIMGGGSNNNAGEVSVCGQSVCSTREPRTPNPKGASSQASARTPKRPTSNGPPQSGRRGQANVEADRCQNCELQERAKERAFVDFQHVVSLIDRAAFKGDISGANSDPKEIIEKLRDMGAAMPVSASAPAPQTPKPTRAAWEAEDGADAESR